MTQCPQPALRNELRLYPLITLQSLPHHLSYLSTLVNVHSPTFAFQIHKGRRSTRTHNKPPVDRWKQWWMLNGLPSFYQFHPWPRRRFEVGFFIVITGQVQLSLLLRFESFVHTCHQVIIRRRIPKRIPMAGDHPISSSSLIRKIPTCEVPSRGTLLTTRRPNDGRLDPDCCGAQVRRGIWNGQDVPDVIQRWPLPRQAVPVRSQYLRQDRWLSKHQENRRGRRVQRGRRSQQLNRLQGRRRARSYLRGPKQRLLPTTQ